MGDEVDRQLDKFFDEYDEIASRVMTARARDFPATLRRWFARLDEAPEVVQREIRRLEALQNWSEVTSEVMGTSGGMLGSAQLTWPDDKDRRLGGQLLLLRQLAAEEIRVVDFSMEYFYVGDGNFDNLVGEMSSNFFDPHAEELRRRMEDVVEMSLEDETLVPASDRIVSLSHNAPSFRKAVQSVELTLDEVNRNNSIDPDDKARVSLELKAGLDLVQAPKTRIEAARALLLGALGWLVAEFGSAVVGQVADAAIPLVRALLGV